MMRANRSSNDPRTIAREIPGLFDSLFPNLVPGIVAHFNRSARSIANCSEIPQTLVASSSLQRAMLFELAVAAGEQLLATETVEWESCLMTAIARQRQHFDAKPPEVISNIDKSIALAVGHNLVLMLRAIESENGDHRLTRAPKVKGLKWVASGAGDFAVNNWLIEVKCSNRHFSSADYRQIMMYWILSYAGAVEDDTIEWSDAFLLNPRTNKMVRCNINETIFTIGGGRSKIELLEQFVSMLGNRDLEQ